jgi:hypothetical protein
MGGPISKLYRVRPPRILIVTLIILAGFLYAYFPKAYGAELPNRSLTLSDNRVNISAIYQLGFNIPASETLGSIELQICSNNPIPTQPCTVPAGFDISSATLSNQTGETGFTILSSGTDSNTIVLTRIPAITPGGDVSYTFQGVINPSSTGPYYGRIQTFPTADASGSDTDFGGLAININNPVSLSSTVPPYLLFCAGITITNFDCDTASGNYINFGNLSSTTTSSAETQMVTATNAATGYDMYVYGTTMTSGNNTINAISAPDVSRPGVSQFGINFVDNQTPSVGANPVGPGVATPASDYDQANLYKFLSGDLVAMADQPADYNKFTTSYIVNIPSDQSLGVYVTSLTYVCLANF